VVEKVFVCICFVLYFSIGLRSEHGWTIDVEAVRTQNFVGHTENLQQHMMMTVVSFTTSWVLYCREPREEALTTVTNTLMTQYTIPIDTNQLPKLPSRDDVKTWWMTNKQTINLRSEHVWTIDGPEVSAQIFVGTHTAPSEHMMMTVVC